MAVLNDDMKQMVARLRLCYVATVTPDGRPNLSPQTMRNLETNPYVEINMVDPFLRRGYRFKGKVEVFTSGPVYDEVANELWTREGKQYPANAVVRVAVDTALPVRSPAYVFNKGVEESVVREMWMKRYGVKPLEG